MCVESCARPVTTEALQKYTETLSQASSLKSDVRHAEKNQRKKLSVYFTDWNVLSDTKLTAPPQIDRALSRVDRGESPNSMLPREDYHSHNAQLPHIG